MGENFKRDRKGFGGTLAAVVATPDAGRELNAETAATKSLWQTPVPTTATLEPTKFAFGFMLYRNKKKIFLR